MLEALVIGVAVVLAAVGAGAVVLAARARRLHRRRSPGVPVSWLWSQGVAARLHRRVHAQAARAARAVRSADRRGQPVVVLEGAVDDLCAEARSLDRRLVAASTLPIAARHKQLFTLRWRVIEHGRVANRVVLMAGDAGLPDLAATDAQLADLRARLDALHQARAELRDAS